MSRFRWIPLLVVLCCSPLLVGCSPAAEPLALAHVSDVDASPTVSIDVPVADPRPDETIVETVPAPMLAPPPELPAWQASGVAMLDERTRAWLEAPPKVGNHFQCAMSCHTTHPYMFVRPAFGHTELLDQAREQLVARVELEGPWPAQTGFYGRRGGRTWRRSLATEAVLNANALALHDHALERPLQDDTLRALDRMWEVQRDDGSWDWLDFGYQPWEAGNDDWGAALAAIAVGLAPVEYRRDHAEPIERLQDHLRARATDERQPMSLHSGLGLLWAGRVLEALVAPTSRARLEDALLAAQRDDGGWALVDLLAPQRVARAIDEPDGYATGLATFVLCDQPRTTSAAARGMEWLREHQLEDGSWPAWSLNRDAPLSHLHMRDAATAYAMLALRSCAPVVASPGS